MVKCEAFGCMSRCRKKESGVTFHSFPNEQERLDMWLKNMKIPSNFAPRKNNKICSKHFEDIWFYHTITGKTKLLNKAVPTILDVSDSVQGKRAISPESEEKIGTTQGLNYSNIDLNSPSFVSVFIQEKILSGSNTSIKIEPCLDTDTPSPFTGEYIDKKKGIYQESGTKLRIKEESIPDADTSLPSTSKFVQGKGSELNILIKEEFCSDTDIDTSSPFTTAYVQEKEVESPKSESNISIKEELLFPDADVTPSPVQEKEMIMMISESNITIKEELCLDKDTESMLVINEESSSNTDISFESEESSSDTDSPYPYTSKVNVSEKELPPHKHEENLRRKLDKEKIKSAEKSKKIRCLNQKIRRATKRLDVLRRLVKELQSKNELLEKNSQSIIQYMPRTYQNKRKETVKKEILYE